MKKILMCKDAGFECPHTIIGATEEDVLAHAAEHFANEHDKTVEEAREIAQKVKESIKEEN